MIIFINSSKQFIGPCACFIWSAGIMLWAPHRTSDSVVVELDRQWICAHFASSHGDLFRCKLFILFKLSTGLLQAAYNSAASRPLDVITFAAIVSTIFTSVVRKNVHTTVCVF